VTIGGRDRIVARAAPLRIGVAVVVAKVPAAHVIDETVAIIIAAVASDLEGVHEQVGGDVLVRALHAVVEHGDDGGRTTARCVPRKGCVHVGVRLAAALTRIVEVPLVREQWIIGDEEPLIVLDEIWLRPLDVGISTERIGDVEGSVRTRARDTEDEFILCAKDSTFRFGAVSAAQGIDRQGGHTRSELEDDTIRQDETRLRPHIEKHEANVVNVGRLPDAIDVVVAERAAR